MKEGGTSLNKNFREYSLVFKGLSRPSNLDTYLGSTMTLKAGHSYKDKGIGSY